MQPDQASRGVSSRPEREIWVTLVEANVGLEVSRVKHEPLGIGGIHIDGDLRQSGGSTTA